MGDEEGPLAEYRRYTRKKALFILAGIVTLFLLTLFALTLGSADLGASDILAGLFGGGNPTVRTIIWQIRLPRILTAIIAGMGLAVSGAVMQSILRNPLGAPFTLGVSHAASFGAAFAIVVLGFGTIQSHTSDAVYINMPYLLPLCAFGFSLISTLVIAFLARFKSASPETMILAGVAMGSLFMAATTAMEYFATDVQLSSIIFWTFGDVGRTSWKELTIIAIIVTASAVFFFMNSWSYNAMDSGEDVAKSLGVNVERTRIVGLILASLVTAIVVSFVGIIGFVGLIVPHIVRKAIGGDARFLIPASCVVGAILLLLSDTMARTVMSPIILPVGILTSFLGAPLFIYLVIRGREHW